MTTNLWRGALVAGVVLSAGMLGGGRAEAAVGVRYEIRALTSPAGAGMGWVSAVGETGVVGGTAWADGAWAPVIWGTDGAAHLLEVPAAMDGTAMWGAGVTVIGTGGRMAGQAIVSSDGPIGAAAWADGRVQWTTVVDGQNALPQSMDRSGRMVGRMQELHGAWSKAAEWMPDGTLVDLSGLVGEDSSVAVATNDRGDVAIDAWESNVGTLVSYYVHDGVVTRVEGPPGTSNVRVNGMNGAGVLVGDALFPDGVGHAFSWAGGVMTDLGVSASTFGSSPKPEGINDAGVIVGSDRDEIGREAILWDNGVRWNLKDLSGAREAGWQLMEAMQINSAGMILGDGLLGDEEMPFLLIPVAPEPAGAWQVALAVITVSWPTRRSRHWRRLAV